MTASPRQSALDVLLTDAAVGNPAARAARRPLGVLGAAARVGRRPDKLAGRAARLSGDFARIAVGRSELAPKKGDRRFGDPAWSDNPLFRRVLQAYLATGQAIDGVVVDAELDWRSDRTLRFLASNLHDALAPTNFPATNPAVIKRTIDTGGANLVKGVRRMGRDVGARRLPAMVDTTKFEVGGNVAVTPGSVVLRTELFELLHYQPTTDRVYREPLLFVPPTINRYYVLDLAPGRSLVEHLVGAGVQTFMMSWRNPDAAHADFDFDAYAGAILEARDAAAEITGAERVHLNAACSGGLLTAGALGHLAATGKLDGIGSLALLVAALDSARAGTAIALTSRELAATAVAESARRGYLDGSALANVFAWLRPNDLVWGYVVNNYWMGKPPPAFDILYWNQDGVRLSAGLHRDFVHLALENAMMEPGAMNVLGSPLDLGAVDVDTYVMAGINDHIVPWENAYRGAQGLGGDRRFVLSTSGHIQALINPPGPESRSSFRVREDLSVSEDELVADTPTTSGSWWPDYVTWLTERAGTRKAARKTLGSARHKPAAEAPGSYVHGA